MSVPGHLAFWMFTHISWYHLLRYSQEIRGCFQQEQRLNREANMYIDLIDWALTTAFMDLPYMKNFITDKTFPVRVCAVTHYVTPCQISSINVFASIENLIRDFVELTNCKSFAFTSAQTACELLHTALSRQLLELLHAIQNSARMPFYIVLPVIDIVLVHRFSYDGNTFGNESRMGDFNFQCYIFRAIKLSIQESLKFWRRFIFEEY